MLLMLVYFTLLMDLMLPQNFNLINNIFKKKKKKKKIKKKKKKKKIKINY